MIKSHLFRQFDCIKHGFFTREGGVSEGVYLSLNCGPGSNDDRDNIIQNRKTVANRLDLKEADRLLTLYQVHGNDVIIPQKDWAPSSPPKADAMVTSRKDIAIGILTADCVPVLIADPDNHVIGAAHAGWRGAVSGIIPNTLMAMKTLGAENSSTFAAIGPCIRQISYEVGEDVYQHFLDKDAGNKRFFEPGKRVNHYYLDLPAYVKQQLELSGIKHVDDLGEDTYSEEERFFSYRRNTHQKLPDYGRQISAIRLI